MPGALPLYFRPPASGLFPRHASSGTLRSGGSDSQNGWMPGALPSYFRHSASGLLPRHGSSGTLGLVGPTAKTGGTGCPAFLFQALRFRALPTARLQRHAGVGWAKRGSSHGEPLFQYSLGFMRPVLSPLFHNRPVRTFLYNPCFPSFGPPAALRCKRLQTFDLVSDLRRKYSSPSDTLSHPAV